MEQVRRGGQGPIEVLRILGEASELEGTFCVDDSLRNVIARQPDQSPGQIAVRRLIVRRTCLDVGQERVRAGQGLPPTTQ